MDNLTEEQLSKVFRNLADLTDFRNCRLVSQKWKRIVMSACRNNFHVVYPLTSSTLYAAHELKDALISFTIYSFNRKEKKDIWAKSGIENLMQTTEWLKFSGSWVSKEEISKIIGLANNSLKILSFRCTKKNLTLPLLEMPKSFNALRKLSIGYYSNETRCDTWNSFTNTLEKWSSTDCRVELPMLESLYLFYDGRSWKYGVRGQCVVKCEDLFRNYVAIGKLLLKYKQTLREVRIERVFTYNVYHFEPHMFRSEWTEIERGLEALDDLTLNRLKVSTITSGYNDSGPGLEIEVLGCSKNLKSLLFQNLIHPYDNWPALIATLSSFKNVDCSNLTSIKMNIELTIRDPTMVINLGVLRECQNLRTLWLKASSANHRLEQLFVKNVELLPQGISILRFEDNGGYRDTMGREILLNRLQMRWIIDNLRGLESLWMGLVIPEQMNENANNEQMEDDAANNVDNGQLQHQEAVNRLVNINLNSFRDLLAMPKMKDIRVDMIKAIALAENIALHWQPVQELGTTLAVIQEYSNLCTAAGYTTTTTTSHNFGADNTYGFATLASQRNGN